MLVKKSKFLFFYHRFHNKFDINNIILGESQSNEEQILALPVLFGQEVIISKKEFEIITQFTEREYTSVDDDKYMDLALFFSYGILLLKEHEQENQYKTFVEREQNLIDDKWHIYATLFHYMTKWKGVDVKLSKEHQKMGGAGVKELIDLNGYPLAPFHKVENYEKLEKIKLADVQNFENDSFFKILKNRKTTRFFEPAKKMLFEDFSKIVFTTFGVQGINTEHENLPVIKRTSPSGGCLHPSEAYFLILRVKNLQPGFYHYDSEFNQLVLLQKLSLNEAIDKAMKLTAGQEYATDGSFLCFISTRYYRNYWKYMKHSGAYLVTIRDAAHLCQTAYILSSYLNIGCFTAAVNQGDIEDELGLNPYKEGIAMMFGCGIINQNEDIYRIQPHFRKYEM